MNKRIPEPLKALVEQLARLPGLGPKSAMRAAMVLLKWPEAETRRLGRGIHDLRDSLHLCSRCGGLSSTDPCPVCADPRRATGTICVVEDLSDLWALERAGLFRGRYHVLGGTLSALDGVGPHELRVPQLVTRVTDEQVSEVILALNATVEGQTTAHYIADALAPTGVAVSTLAQGVPVGGELDYLDDGTIGAALRARRRL